MTTAGVRRDWIALAIGFAVVMAVEFVLILFTTDGNFTYTLDDPYIHLALAENLARSGHYGINIEEYASASSSIIWPLLLVPFFALGFGTYGPLLLNLLFALAALMMMHRIVLAAVTPKGGEVPRLTWAGTLVIFFAVNGFGVVFTGMEHTLHMLVTAAIIYFINDMVGASGKAGAAHNRYADALLVLCIVLSPLVRFEGVAIAAFAILMLVALGKPRLAIVSIGLMALCLAAYFYAMSALGLPFLPSSVLVKSGSAANVAAQGDLIARLYTASLYAVNTAIENSITPEGRLLLLIAAVIAIQAIRLWRSPERIPAVYVIGVLAVIALHFAFGRFGWYGRYQCYVFVFAIGAALHVFSGVLHRQQSLSQERRLLYGLAAVFILATLGFRQSFFPLVTTPIGAQNIYEQQRQMHVFVTDYWKAPVAVNDIGYVAFQNDGYVLDLWGLGSEEARRLRLSRDPDMLHKLTGKHGIHLAMIYEEPFADLIPPDWRKIADLNLTSRAVTRDFDRVAFFVFGLDRDGCSEVSARLKDFAHALPQPQNLAIDAHACETSPGDVLLN